MKIVINLPEGATIIGCMVNVKDSNPGKEMYSFQFMTDPREVEEVTITEDGKLLEYFRKV